MIAKTALSTDTDRPPRSSSERIAQDVIKGLIEGRFAPGQRLVEGDLTRRYGVGRGSVREALSHLAAEGVVVLELHRGAYIRATDRDEAIETLTLLEVMTGLAARLAAERIESPGARDRLQEALERVLAFDPHSHSTAYGQARVAFFDALNAIGGNRELTKLLPNLQLCLVGPRFARELAPAQAVRTRDFTAIGKAVLIGDGRAAERAARCHVRRTLEMVKTMPAEAFGDLIRRNPHGSSL